MEGMDFCRNVSVSGGFSSDYQPEHQILSPTSCSKLGTLDDLFSSHTTEEGDVNLEWLSIFVEDCLSSSGNCLPPALAVLPSNPQSTTTTANTVPKTSKPLQFLKTQLENTPPLHRFVVPGKARSKRKRTPVVPKSPFTTTRCWSHSHSHHYLINPKQAQTLNSDPPLLQQAYWLADSELILPKEEEQTKEGEECSNGGRQGQGRRCSHCLSQRTPQWRAGPLGPKTLCNACGVRYKSGRLLPEYRPAKSPTFVSYKHSNSHKKVLEMRMSLLSSPSNSSSS